MSYKLRRKGRLGLIIDGQEIQTGEIIEIKTHSPEEKIRGKYSGVFKSALYHVEIIDNDGLCICIPVLRIRDIRKIQEERKIGEIRFISGFTGSGKSHAVKQEIMNMEPLNKKEIIVIDPYGEYGHLCNDTGKHIDFSEHKQLMNMREDLDTFQTLLDSKTDGIIMGVTFKYLSDKMTDILSNIIQEQENLDMIVLNIKAIRETVMESCYMCLLDFIRNRVLENEQKDIQTYVYIESCEQFIKPDAVRYFMNILHEMESHGCFITAIGTDTKIILDYISENDNQQNDYVFHLFRQRRYHGPELKRKIGLSDEKIEYLMNAKMGQGIIIRNGHFTIL